MNLPEIELPSDRKFGFFFAAIFFAACIYFYIVKIYVSAYIFTFLGALFFVLAILRPVVLHPLNNFWMRFGQLLGMIVSPIVLGIIFFFLFTPIGLTMRLAGRDELRLKVKKKFSHWIHRDSSPQPDSFNQQF
jgi:hypothetical protein